VVTRSDIALLLFFVASLLKAQDPQFTQFYAAPMFLNPAFAGLTDEHRFSANYRRQWPGIKQSFTTYMAAYDYNIADLNSGIGGFVWQDKAGTSNFVTTQGGINFSYKAKLTRTSDLRGGIMVGLGQKKLDNSTLVFNDQLLTGSSTSRDYKADNLTFVDLGAGALYSNEKYWMGVTVKHINRPNVSMVGNTELLPAYISAHAGYRHVLSNLGSKRSEPKEYINASVHFRHQQKYDQFDIGAYYFKNFMNIGLWYRGLPLKKYAPGYSNQESIALLIGLIIPDKNLKVGYSYDMTISRLGFTNTMGSHEISFVYEVARKKRKKRVYISCPKF
jgi:type IX secretion system PorP/SprF family membrane protein